MKISIQPAGKALSKEIEELIVVSSKQTLLMDFSSEGEEHFLRIHTAEAIRTRIEESVIHLVARVSSRVVGVLAIKNHYHIFSCYIHPNYFRKGIALALFRFWYFKLIEKGQLKSGVQITVNASRFALPFYSRLGFETVGDEKNKDGIIYTPMKARSLNL